MFPSLFAGDGPNDVEVGSMEHKTTMVREYANEQEFREDERKLGQEGWSAETTGNPYAKQGLLSTLRARFSGKKSGLVVTYHREESAPRRRR